MRTVSARDANQQFSKLLAEAESGKDVVITKRGRPVAQLVAYRGKKYEKDRKAALADLMKLLDKGVDLGEGYRFNRDDLYDR
ncbi:MAG: type II toxin-antitoxin system prevent-host-death family antitoxin [Alphaproteobacteria bacterium]|nr:type II toxin-antitoxin system prevent-host-death family antitoxin [Alphaproteobacteria bacterium]